MLQYKAVAVVSRNRLMTTVSTDAWPHVQDLQQQLDEARVENRMLRQELRTTHEAADITAALVVKQFERTESTLGRLEQAKTLAESALLENKGIFDNAPFGICFTFERKIIRYNRAFADIFGFESESGFGEPGRVLYPSEQVYVDVGRQAGPLLAKNLPFEHELLMQRQDGSTFWANLKAYVANPEQPSIGTVWLVQDRSAFKAAQAEIEESVEEMTAIFEASTFGIAFIKNRVMIKANHKLEELFGYAAGDLSGQPTRWWYADEDSYRSVGDAYAELEQGNTHRRVLPMCRKNGSQFWARLSGVALSADPARGSVWTVEDITAEYEATAAMQRAKEAAESAELKLRENYAELEQANLRLRELDQLKSDFLSSVSHELRTPLTSIRGFTQLVEREFQRSFSASAEGIPELKKKSDRIRDNLGIILKESDRLTRLINDVLDLAKIEAGRVEWRDVLLSPSLLLQETVKTAQGMFDLKPEIQLRVELTESLPSFVGDADRLQQVLANLLGNAVKFTDVGTVTLRATSAVKGWIQIEVIDTGIGFPPEEAEAIFDKFQQARQGDTLVDRPKGTGLGLAIAREIIERHGGRIWAESQPGKGSKFSLMLPCVVATAVDGQPG